ncbi:hypothetical protein ACIRPK_22785 [Kitasatospora sp. NPDC101801]|uniref:hypothetical protein n=1 Tax=Kitasatospora sp. NPDC101801 TaxID=3364103 RepID=UPI00380C289A
MAVNVPGCTTRTAQALADTAQTLGLDVTVADRPGRDPLFALGGPHATAGIVDPRGIALALLVEHRRKAAPVSDELLWAAGRLTASGTHAKAVAYVLPNVLTDFGASG